MQNNLADECSADDFQRSKRGLPLTRKGSSATPRPSTRADDSQVLQIVLDMIQGDTTPATLKEGEVAQTADGQVTELRVAGRTTPTTGAYGPHPTPMR